jgi:hypothetical protein
MWRLNDDPTTQGTNRPNADPKTGLTQSRSPPLWCRPMLTAGTGRLAASNRIAPAPVPHQLTRHSTVRQLFVTSSERCGRLCLAFQLSGQCPQQQRDPSARFSLVKTCDRRPHGPIASDRIFWRCNRTSQPRQVSDTFFSSRQQSTFNFQISSKFSIDVSAGLLLWEKREPL